MFSFKFCAKIVLLIHTKHFFVKIFSNNFTISYLFIFQYITKIITLTPHQNFIYAAVNCISDFPSVL